MKQTLKLLAPYLAVAVFWCGLSSAWLAILAYHAQILFWARRDFTAIGSGCRRRIMLLALPAALGGPLLYVLLPFITHTELAAWLSSHHLSGWSFMLMIPYFGLLHPLLEQIHWAPLREQTPLAHPLFAGYHLLVLFSLLTGPWLIVCFAILTAASFLWKELTQRTHSIAVPVVSHILADAGIIMAAWLSL